MGSSDVRSSDVPKRNESAPYHVHLRDEERRLIATALHAEGNNVERAAEILGVGVRYLRARIRQLGGVLGVDRNEPPKPIWPKKKA